MSLGILTGGTATGKDLGIQEGNICRLYGALGHQAHIESVNSSFHRTTGIMPTFLPDFIPLYDAVVIPVQNADAASGSGTQGSRESDVEGQPGRHEDRSAVEYHSNHHQSSENQECHNDELPTSDTSSEDYVNCIKDKNPSIWAFGKELHPSAHGDKSSNVYVPTIQPSGNEAHPNALFGRDTRKSVTVDTRQEFYASKQGELGELFVRGDRKRETQFVTYHDDFYDVYWSNNQRHWRKRKRSMIRSTVSDGEAMRNDGQIENDTSSCQRDRSRSPLSRTILQQDTERDFDEPVDEGTKLLASARKRQASNRRRPARSVTKKQRINTRPLFRSPSARAVFPLMPATPQRQKQRRDTTDITMTQQYQDWVRKLDEQDESDIKAIYDAVFSPTMPSEDTEDEVFSVDPVTIRCYKPFFMK